MATMDFAARVTTGRPWPDGTDCALGSVILVAGEDDPADTIRPRLDAHGADPKRVHLLRGSTRVAANGVASEVAFSLNDIDVLESTLASVPDCALVIVDPIGSFVGGGVDAHRDNEVRAVLAPLAILAERSGAAVLLVAHLRKGAALHADDMVLGSRAFTGVARSVLHLVTDHEDDERRLLVPGKSNLARAADGLAFRIEGEPAKIQWEDDPVKLTADGALANAAGATKRSKRADAGVWLREYLACGPKPADEVFREGESVGFSSRTLERAKKEAKVRTIKASFDGGWAWALPEASESLQRPDAGGLGMQPEGKPQNDAKAANVIP